MKKIVIGAIIFCIGVACSLILVHGSLQAQGSINDGDVMAKLNEIAKSQEEILDTVNSLKEDIHLIKIRVTQNQ